MALTETTEASEAAESQPAASAERPVSPPVGSWPPATDHKVIGSVCVLVAVLFLGATGVLGVMMRSQLVTPRGSVVSTTVYRQLFTLHGLLGVFGFLAPVWVGLATALVPLQIGSARLAFPRLQALVVGLFVAGGALLVASPFVKGAKPITGWALSTPIPEGRAFRGHGPDLVILGVAVVAVALVLASANLLVTVLKLRAPGLTLRRTPLFSWSVAVSASVLILALPVLLGGLTMLFVDRHYGGHVFSGFTGSGGGNPNLWPRIFWFAAYPMLWALLLPGLGVICEIVPVFARRRLFSRPRAVAALAAVGVLAFAGWGSEVPGLHRARGVFAVGALLVLAPVASLVLNWLTTVVTALLPPRTTRPALRSAPMLYAGGAVTVLALGLAGGVVAAVGATTTAHRNHWQVATQHTLFFGVAILAVAAALSYWAPKLWGRHLSEKAAVPGAGLLTLGLLLTFVPAYVLGAQDMRVHLATYSGHDELWAANVVSTLGAFVLALGLLVLAADLVVNVVGRRGRRPGDDPWQGHTLEWATSSPPPSHNFDRLPEIRSEAPLLDLRPEATPVDQEQD
jgi:heme/copper-type cytochrome/quinol oxidase subunit 1